MKQHKLLKRVFAVLFAGALMLGSVDSSAFQVNAEGAVTNVTFTATAMEEINQSGETALTTVKSGQPFFLAVKYTFSSPGDGYSYAGGTLQIQLPDKAVIDEAATSELFSSHATIFSSWKQDGQYLYFYTPDNQTISAGASGTLYIKLSYQNMETPNGYGAAVKEQFRNMEFTGTLLNSSGQSVPMDKILIDPLSVVNQADQTWSIYKSVVKNGTSDYTETDQYFNVEYGLEVSAGDGKNAVYDRFGRLSCNVFEFTDTLPALTAGVIENGKVIGYPKGGGAQKVLIVANKNDENQKTLVEGKDYTLEYEADGTTIKAVHFQYINQSGGNAIPDKTPINTTYSIVASYPKAAYEIAGNESSFSKYHLVNNASLEYQPLGKALQKVEANAPVDLGWVDLLAKHYDFTIKKQVQISAGLDGIEDVQDFDKDLQDIYYAYSGAKKVMFGLYKNKECTQVAVNFDGTVDVGKPQAVDKFGMISFEGLLAGKYYLKETSTIDGFQALDVKEVIISKNGEITVDGKKMNGAYKAVNKTDKDGFGYVAFWKKGNNAGGVSGYLPNIEFTLTSNTDSSIQYHAVSNTSGMVLFTGVKAGTYTLKEVDKGDGEFEKLSDEYEVEVIGNQVNYPYIKNTKDSLKKDENNHPYILNISKKGSIKIIKQDAATKEYLKGSAFVAYGPYRDQPDLTKFTIPSDKTLIHEIASEFTDGSKYFALDNGYYVLQEKQAPSNYVLDSSFTNVFIEQGKTTVVPFENTEAGALQIKKTGAMSASLDFKVPLAGAEFTVYTDAEATVIAKDINKQDAVLTTVMSQGEAVSNLVKLKPGTYYLKETKTPFGYKSDPTITAVEITSGVKTPLVKTFNNEVNKLGQIIITKQSAESAHQKLANVKFEIYNSANELADTVTTDKNGTAKSIFLKPGKYTVKEINVPNGYSQSGIGAVYASVDANGVAQTTGTGIDVTDNTQIHIAVENKPLVDYVIEKVDGTTNEKLGGVLFGLYENQADALSDKNRIRRISSNANGQVVFDKLEPGQVYYYKELIAKDGYVIDDSIRQFTAPDKAQDFKQSAADIPQVMNIMKGKFSVYKTLKDYDGTTKPLGGITFVYYAKVSDDAEVDWLAAAAAGNFKQQTTDKNGEFTSLPLTPGQYWVKELADDTYQPATPRLVEVKPDNDAAVTDIVNVTNIPSKGKLSIKKVDSLTNAPVVTAKFNVYKYLSDNTDYAKEKPVTSFTVNNNGEWELTLAPGDYVLIETDPDQSFVKDFGYVVDKDTFYRVQVTAGKINTVYYQQPISNVPKGRFKLDKLEVWNKRSDGSWEYEYRQEQTFQIYADEGLQNLVATMKSSSTETVYSPYLAAGDYWVKEIIDTSAYEDIPAQKVTIGAGQNHEIKGIADRYSQDHPEAKAELRFENISKQSKIRITKIDAETKQKLNRSEFEVYRKVTADTPNAEEIEGTGIYVVKVSDTHAISGTADIDGDGKIDHGEAFTVLLEPGETYYLKEVKAPDGYRMLNEWTGPITVTAGEITHVTIENFKPTAVVGDKADDVNNPVSQAYLSLFLDQESAQQAVTALAVDGSKEALDFIAKAKNPNLWSSLGIVETAVSDARGHFNFTNLNTAAIYYAVEIETGSAYTRDPQIHTVEIKKVNDQYVLYEQDAPFVLVNDRKGQIKVKKVTELSGQRYAIDGVNFTVYKAKSQADDQDLTAVGDSVGHYTTGTKESGVNGTFISGWLEPGWYILQEDLNNQPNSIDPSASLNTFKVLVTKGAVNTVYFDAPIMNTAKQGKFAIVKESAKQPGLRLSATFELQKLEAGSWKTVTAAGDQGIITVSKDQVYISDFLDPGDYRLIEKTTDPHYTVDSTPIPFSISAGKITAANAASGFDIVDQYEQPYVITNQPKGSLSLIKKGHVLSSDAYEPMAGVTFKVYTNSGNQTEDLAKPEIASASTDVNGSLHIEDLDAGDYWIVETAVDPQGSSTHHDLGYRAGFIKSLHIDAGQDTVVASDGKDFVANDSTYGKLQITKVDYKTKGGLKGAVFGIYPIAARDQEPIQKVTSDSNGIVISEPLSEGEYYLKELSAPDHYLLNQKEYGPYKVVAGQITKSGEDVTAAPSQIENYGKTFIQIIKQDTNGQAINTEYMKDASFGLYKTQNDAENKTNAIEIISGGKTAFSTPLMPETAYWVRELKAPNGYVLDETPRSVTTGSAAESIVSLTLQNSPYGSLTIEKRAQWELPTTSSTQQLPLSGVSFSLYKYRGDTSDHHGDLVETKKTDADGKLTFMNLPAGDYVLYEATPDGFADPDTAANNIVVTILEGQENTELTATHALINYPRLGKFIFTKMTIDTDHPIAMDETSVVKATFQLQKRNDSGNFVDVAGYEAFHPSKNGSFESGMLEPGAYQLIETAAPDGYQRLTAPIPFTITAKQITTVANHESGKIINQALGNVEITKYSDAHVYDKTGAQQTLASVTFSLYKGDHTQISADTLVASLKTNEHGIALWKNLEPGIYTVKETNGLTGFAQNDAYYEVTVLSNQSEVKTYTPDRTDDPAYISGGQIYNESTMGKLVIHKTDTAGKPLKNAVFHVYAYDEHGKPKNIPEEVITTNADGYGFSKLLAASKSGTAYLVREVEAPSGYSLDEQYEMLEKVVTVKPLQSTDIIIANNEQYGDTDNYIAFKNTLKNNYEQYKFKVDKGILSVSGSRSVNGEDKQMYAHEYDKASSVDEQDTMSLLESDSKIAFKIFGFADGQNKIDAENVIVTDDNIKMQYLKDSLYVDEAMTKDAYAISSITIHRAYIGGSDAPVHAEIQYQTYGQSSTVWTSLKTIHDVQNLSAAGETVDVSALSDKIVHFRVIYSGTKANFYSDGIDFKALFKQRASDASAHEIRRITNAADVQYQFNVKDETGNVVSETLDQQQTKTVEVRYPLLQTSRPKVDIDISVDNDKAGTKTFNPGDQVLYTLKASNTSYNAAQLFDSPIVSFDLPVGLSLDDVYPSQSSPYLVMIGKNPSEGKTIDLKNVRIVESNTAAKEINDAGEVVTTSKTTKKITMFFDGLTIEPGMNLFVRFSTHISRGSNSVNNLIAPSYLSSSQTVPQSVENPYGNSFDATSMGGAMVNDEDLDKIIDGTSGPITSSVPRYVFAHDAISVSEINNLSIYKEAKGQSDKEYKGSGQAATTVPNGSMDYRIVVKNGSTSTNKVTKARVLDILPFAGDTLVNRSNLNGTPTDRGTSIVKRPILKKDGVKVYDHDGIEIPSQYVTIYYCVDPIETWTAANRSAAQRELDLPMIYGTMESGAWTSGNRNWVTDLSGYTMDQVTAIGAEVDFQAMKLAEGSDFTIHIGMTAPNFTTDEIDDITDKFYFNSAMCAVLRDGHDAGEAISDDNRTENDPVKMKVNLPKGSIGDYAFVDRNNDGLQDAGDVALSGVGVTLYTYRKGIDDAVPVLIGTKKTTTDQSGYYLFDNLDCNNPLEGRSKDSDDPNDFVGKVIYSYKLEFESPVDESVYSYKPTLQYAGSKAYPAADSNIDSDGLTDFVRLTVTKEADGNLLGEDDPTIDAGFVSLGALGDYVWIDDNRNGIQDVDEKGIEGVTVNLLEKKDGILRYKKSVTTDKDGFYIFKELPAGEYVVEFDITSVSSTGYSRYEFTKYVDDVNAADVNSDAKNMVPATDDQVARTDVIKLEDRGIDMSIDAGLTYYSALSGRTFEDRNFDDLNNNAAADIPLLKTKVELYRVVSGIREKDPYMSQPVKDDGTYLFDKLLPGTYQVRFIFPQGYDIVKGNIGFDDTIDSDITYVEDSGESGFTDVITVKGNSIEKYWGGGARRYSSLGDYVWNDSNKDGLQDLDEQPIANVRVYLQRQAPGEDFWTVQSETMTDKYGRYRFDHLEGSTYTGIKYRIFFDLSPFTQLTIPRNGDTELDSNALPTYMAGWGFPTDIIKLGYASEDMSWDAGIIETSGSIGDYVWFDTNRNGIQDEAGTGIGNVLVVLERSEDENLNDSSWVKVGETYTNASGYYRFDGLAEGYYRVKFYLPNSYVTTPNQGTDIERDSDGIRRIQDWSVTRPFYLSEGGYDMSWDCGIYDGNPSIKTGDTTNTQLYIMLMMFSMGSVVYLWRRRKMI